MESSTAWRSVLAVMGENLALNMADHGYRVAVYNRTTAVMQKFVAGHRDTPGGLVGTSALPEFVAALEKPRKILILVKQDCPWIPSSSNSSAPASRPTTSWWTAASLWTDTIRREKQYAERCRFFGSGVSGGEVGARFGPSLMPGGHPASWEHLRPIWEAIAAKVDPKTGKPLEDWAPGKPVTGGQPAPRRSTSGPSPPSGVAAASFERASSRRSPRPTAVTPAS
jgi:6-phosphogluconate dehydrogenase